jgi:hypothetical protein
MLLTTPIGGATLAVMANQAASTAPIPIRPPADAQGRVTEAEAQAMLRAVLNLLNKWGLQTDEKLVLLGRPSERTFQRWRAGQIGPLPNDTIFRLGDLLGIHKALRYMFTDVARAYAWINRANDAFGGKSALDVMLQGAPTDIARVRAYLDAERAGW